MKNKISILCIFAHPDDESFVCGGMLAAAKKKKQSAVLLCLTRGEASTQYRQPTWSPHTLQRRRQAELRRAGKILGIRRIHLASFPDGQLHAVSVARLIRVIRQYVRRYRPQNIYTFAADGFTGHRDHRVVAKVVMQALQNYRAFTGLTIYQFTASPRQRRSFQLPPLESRAVQRFDIQKCWPKKIAAIHSYASQVKTMERYRRYSSEQLRRLFRWECAALITT